MTASSTGAASPSSQGGAPSMVGESTQPRRRGESNASEHAGAPSRDGKSRRPRIVASDLDGTLLDARGRVSARTHEVWSGLAELGIETIVVTARPPRWLDHLAQLVDSSGSDVDAGGHTVAICGNGAFVYDLATRRVLEAHGFSADEAVAVVEHVQQRFPNAGAAVETDRGMFRSSAYPDAHAGLPAHDAGVVDCELAHLPTDVVVGKVLLRDEAWRGDVFVDALQECLGERGVLAYSGAAGLAEITAPGVTKAARLAAWCAERGVPASEVWAFGDMPNDIPMLTWVGRGVAVENAHEEVLAVADDTCGANHADGVAAYLQARLY